ASLVTSPGSRRTPSGGSAFSMAAGRSRPITAAPRSANSAAVAAPSPDAAPVTNAVVPPIFIAFDAPTPAGSVGRCGGKPVVLLERRRAGIPDRGGQLGAHEAQVPGLPLVAGHGGEALRVAHDEPEPPGVL